MTNLSGFSHDAMNTTFTLRIAGEHPDEAAGVARECFAHLDYLENKLSRYIEGSDVWQINHMEDGQSLFLSEPTYECLRLALDIAQQTGGLFDVTLGTMIEQVKGKGSGRNPPLQGSLAVDPEKQAIHCLEAGREVDLGGIGKGFALDQMKARLTDWGIRSALLGAGSSTHLAFGEPGWNVDLTGENEPRSLHLKDSALSASGTGIQGSHILAPDGTVPAYACSKAWVLGPSAAEADAWSTALMLINPDDFTEQIPPEIIYLVENHGQFLGNFPGTP